MKKKTEREKAQRLYKGKFFYEIVKDSAGQMSFGKWLITGLLSAIFVYGLIAFHATKDTSELGGAAILMVGLTILYGFYKMAQDS